MKLGEAAADVQTIDPGQRGLRPPGSPAPARLPAGAGSRGSPGSRTRTPGRRGSRDGSRPRSDGRARIRGSSTTGALAASLSTRSRSTCRATSSAARTIARSPSGCSATVTSPRWRPGSGSSPASRGIAPSTGSPVICSTAARTSASWRAVPTRLRITPPRRSSRIEGLAAQHLGRHRPGRPWSTSTTSRTGDPSSLASSAVEWVPSASTPSKSPRLPSTSTTSAPASDCAPRPIALARHHEGVEVAQPVPLAAAEPGGVDVVRALLERSARRVRGRAGCGRARATAASCRCRPTGRPPPGGASSCEEPPRLVRLHPRRGSRRDTPPSTSCSRRTPRA